MVAALQDYQCLFITCADNGVDQPVFLGDAAYVPD
jgi:carbonic anhydrase